MATPTDHTAPERAAASAAPHTAAADNGAAMHSRRMLACCVLVACHISLLCGGTVFAALAYSRSNNLWSWH